MFKNYDVANLKGDITGGLVAGVIALPLALAFGVQSGLGAAAGLYGAICLGILAAALGGTRTQASGPTGPMTVVSASVVALAVERMGNVESGLGIIFLAFLSGGLFQIVFGLLGIGKYVKYFPYPVVSGFMSGVGVIIIALQVWPFLGSPSPKSVIKVFTGIATPLGQINWSAVLVGAITVAVYYIMPRITKALPSVLIALIVGTVVAVVANLDVPVIGDIPAGIPALQIGNIFRVGPENYPTILSFGLTLALLGSIDSLLTSVIADNVTKTKHDSRRELIGQGIGNAVAAIFGGIPGAGSTKGTVVNINAGGQHARIGRFARRLPARRLAGRRTADRLHSAQRFGRSADSGRHRDYRHQGPAASALRAFGGRGGSDFGAGHDGVWQPDSRRRIGVSVGEFAVYEEDRRFGRGQQFGRADRGYAARRAVGRRGRYSASIRRQNLHQAPLRPALFWLDGEL